MDELPKLSYVPKDVGNPGKPYIVNGSPVTITQAARRLGLSKAAISHRLEKGIPPEVAFTCKVLPPKWNKRK